MKRNILVCIGGIILTLLFLLLCAWLALKFTTFGKITTESAALGRAMEHKEVVAKYGQNPFKYMHTELRIGQFVLFPLLSILIGIYVGVLARKNEVLIAGITLLPFVIFTTSSDTSRATAFGFSILYLGICCLTTNIIVGRKVTSQSNEIASNQKNAPDQNAVR